MKTISFDAAFSILDNCSAVIWGDTNFSDTNLSYPEMRDEGVTDAMKDCFMCLALDDFCDGMNFFRGANQTVRAEASTLYLVNDQGHEVRVIPLIPQPF